MTSKRRWSDYEDSVVITQVKANPQNLHACFLAASEIIDRNEHACSARWYKHLSKMPENACFVTISGRHKALNRKNSAGTVSSNSLFRRILRMLHLS